MEISEIKKIINKYFYNKNIQVSESAIKTFLSVRYLNMGLLMKMKKEEIEHNFNILLKEVLEKYESRTRYAERKTKVRDIDVKPVLKKKFCSLPPICK